MTCSAGSTRPPGCAHIAANARMPCYREVFGSSRTVRAIAMVSMHFTNMRREEVGRRSSNVSVRPCNYVKA